MKQGKKDSEARRRVISAALDLFYRQGYRATGINQVIAEAGVSKNTFYHHFPSKEDLCVTYLRERHVIWLNMLKDDINSWKTPLERLLAPFEFLRKWLPECDYRGCAFLNITSEVPDIDSPIRKEVIYHKDGLRTIFRELAKDLQKSGDAYAKLDPVELSNACYTIFEGAISACQNFGEIWPADTAKRTVKKLLL